MKKWSSQGPQFMQLRKEARKKNIQDFNRVWTREQIVTSKAVKRISGFNSCTHVWYSYVDKTLFVCPLEMQTYKFVVSWKVRKDMHA